MLSIVLSFCLTYSLKWINKNYLRIKCLEVIDLNILVKKQRLDTIPYLEVVEEKNSHQCIKTVLFIHGFTSAKEHNLHYAYLLAEKGFRVILPDTLYHGEREVGFNEVQLSIHFWEIVLQTIRDIEKLRNHLVEQKKIISNIGLIGTSMGGIITLGALSQYDWIQSAVSLMGNPCYVDYAKYQLQHMQSMLQNVPIEKEKIDEILVQLQKYDLSKQPHRINSRPLLFWHGKKDNVVPYHFAYQFYLEQKDKEKQMEFILDDHAGHKVPRKGVLQIVEWIHQKMESEKISFSS